MLQKNLFNIIILCLFFRFSIADEIQRISEIIIDESKASQLIVTPGRATMILFPCPIISTAKGTGGDYDIQIKETDQKELILWLNNSFSEPSGLIVRCEKRVFVFDIIPSAINHQDFVKISGSFGSPQNTISSQNVIKSSIDHNIKITQKENLTNQYKKVKFSSNQAIKNSIVGRNLKEGH